MPQTAGQALERTQLLYEQIVARRPSVCRAEEYYRGKQPLRFASDRWREFHAERYRDFSDNWCAPVANSPNERLRLDGFRLDDDPALSNDEKLLWRDWQINNMEAQSSQGWLASIVTGRSYVNVWGTVDNEPIATWERSDQMTIGYDVERPWLAIDQLKTWHDGATEYATYATDAAVWKWERPYLEVRKPEADVYSPTANAFFYTPNGIVLRGSSDLTGWKPRQPASDDTWPIPNPLGVIPGVEMPNRPILGGEPLSDIGGTMSMQDAINLLWAYLFSQADFAGMPARVVMGQEPPMMPVLDATGAKVGEKPVDMKKLQEDRILWLTGQNAKISQWDAAKLDMFTGVIETAVTHVAAQTRTPPHYLVLGKGMVNVSAEGMKAAETGLVMKTKELQLFLTPPSRGIFQRFALARNSAGLAEKARFGEPKWKDAENHSEAQLVDALLKLHAIGFPFAWLAEQYGLGQTEIDRVLKMKESEAAADPLAALIQQPRPAAQLPPAPAA